MQVNTYDEPWICGPWRVSRHTCSTMVFLFPRIVSSECFDMYTNRSDYLPCLCLPHARPDDNQDVDWLYGAFTPQYPWPMRLTLLEISQLSIQLNKHRLTLSLIKMSEGMCNVNGSQGPSTSAVPGPPEPQLNPFVPHFIDEEVIREPTGTSIVEPDSVLGESGRTYHGYKEGKYLLPNDEVRRWYVEFFDQHADWRRPSKTDLISSMSW